MAAVAALAADRETGEPFVQALWDTKIPSGQWRYYDGLLYMLGMLHVSGNFKIYITYIKDKEIIHDRLHSQTREQIHIWLVDRWQQRPRPIRK